MKSHARSSAASRIALSIRSILPATSSFDLIPGTGVTYNPERLKLVWDKLLLGAGVKMLLHAWLCDVELAKDGRIVGAILHTKRGFLRVTGKRFIDASGDADLCHLAAIPYEKAGDIEPAQTLTTTFRMSNVDLERFEAEGGKKMLMAKMAQAVELNRHPLPRKKGSAHAMVQEGCIATVAVRVGDTDATDPEQLTSAEIEGRRQAFIYEDFLRDMVPGYEKAKIIGEIVDGVCEEAGPLPYRAGVVKVAGGQDQLTPHQRGYGGKPGLAWLLTVLPVLLRERGVEDNLVERILIHWRELLRFPDASQNSRTDPRPESRWLASSLRWKGVAPEI